jgi:hypothetical protein
MWQETKFVRATPFAAALAPVPIDRRDDKTLVDIHDLIAFARCGGRWAHGQLELPNKGYAMHQLLNELLLVQDARERGIVREPETFKTRALVCPGCDSESHSKHCTRCDCDRKVKEVTKAWSRNAKPCQSWVEACFKENVLPVRAKDYDLAAEAAEAARRDPDIAKLLDGSECGRAIISRYHPGGEGSPVWVSQPVDIIPGEGHPLDQCIGMVYASADAGHARHSTQAHYGFHHMAAALALDLANVLTGRGFSEVLQALVEVPHPHTIGRRRLAAEFIAEGRRLLYETLDALALARKRDRYAVLDDSAPGQLAGWTTLDHDPFIGEGADHTDARYTIHCADRGSSQAEEVSFGKN